VLVEKLNGTQKICVQRIAQNSIASSKNQNARAGNRSHLVESSVNRKAENIGDFIKSEIAQIKQKPTTRVLSVFCFL
jgi:hypothetical protein